MFGNGYKYVLVVAFQGHLITMINNQFVIIVVYLLN